MIPRILHRVVPEATDIRSEEYWDRLSAMHPDWEFRTWRDPIDLSGFEIEDAAAACRSGAQLADFLRVEILLRHGGIYIDSDCEPVRSFEPLLRYSCFIGTEDGWHLTNAVMGCEPGHPAMRAYLDALITEDRVHLDAPANEATGPHLATAILGGRQDVTVLPPEFFYSQLQWPSSAQHQAQPSPHAYCIHQWAGSWLDHAAPPSAPTAPSAIRSAARGVGRRAVRHARAALDRIRPPSVQQGPFATYVGGNRVLVSLPDGLHVQAIANDLSITPELVAHGMYDWPFWRFLNSVIKPGDHVIDVGANIGLFSLAMARGVGRFGQVLAFEPDPELSELLRRNVAENWMSERVVIHQTAVGDESAEWGIRINPDFRMLSSASPTGERHAETVVHSTRLDGIVDPLIPIRLVKIDVEGGEWRVLAGLRGLLEGGIIEYLDVEVIRSNAGDEWRRMAYQLRALVADFDGTAHVLNPDGTLEPAVIDRVIATAGHFPHVVFTFPRRNP